MQPERTWKRRDDYLIMQKGHFPLKEKNIIEKISESRKEQQSDSRDARPVEINDWARAGAELPVIEV